LAKCNAINTLLTNDKVVTTGLFGGFVRLFCKINTVLKIVW